MSSTYFYLRVSSLRQAEQSGLQSQRIACQKFFDLNSAQMPPLATPTPWFEDAISTKRGGGMAMNRRPQGAQLLQKLQRGDHLVVASTSRLGRTANDAVETLIKLDRAGVAVWVVNLSINTATPMGRLAIRMLAEFAELDNRERAERRKSAMDIAWSAGVASGRRFLPPGYRYADDDRRYVEPDHREMRLVELLKAIYTDGLPKGSICTIVVNERIPRADGGGNPPRPGLMWSAERVRGVLAAVRDSRPTLSVCERKALRKALTKRIRDLYNMKKG